MDNAKKNGNDANKGSTAEDTFPKPAGQNDAGVRKESQQHRDRRFRLQERGKLTSPVKPIPTVSTVGTGDNYNAVFLFGLISKGIRREDCGNLSAEDWAGFVEVASPFSSNVCRSIHNHIEGDPEALGI